MSIREKKELITLIGVGSVIKVNHKTGITEK